MSLLTEFSELLTSITVYSLEAVTSSWGTSEKQLSTTGRTIEGYIQPQGGGDVFNNQADTTLSTHRLYIYATETVEDTDVIELDGVRYNVVDNPGRGVSGINDHREVGLKKIGQ